MTDHTDLRRPLRPTEASMVDLKPCPFCGGPAKMVTYRIAEDAMGATVRCASCQACIAEFEDAYAPVDEAEDAWNRRADADEITTLRARIAELEAKAAEVDDIAAVLWRAESEDAGAPASIAAGRTRDAFNDQSDSTKTKWRKLAVAAIRAMKGGKT